MIEYEEGSPSTLNIDPKEYYQLIEDVKWTQLSSKFTLERVSQSYIHSQHMVAARKENKLIGTGRIITDGFYAFIIEVMIIPTYQRKGIGSAIMKRLIHKCIQDDIPNIYLWSAEGKSVFYEKLGFKYKDPKTPFMYYKYD